jgi:hypothetical protein
MSNEEMREDLPLLVKEETVLSKFEGDPEPENEFERIHIVDGNIVSVSKIEHGEVVSTETFESE